MEAEAIPDPIPVPIDAPALPPQVAPVFPINPKKRPSQAPGAERRRASNMQPRSFLWYGDNLDVLREHIKDESVDLVYLDPPFNSNKVYNVIFQGPDGLGAPAQIQAFDDTWRWSDATNEALQDIRATAPLVVQSLIDALCEALDRNNMTAYLVMMTQRLLELRRVMKPTASLYLHCDPTASHYLKIVLDSIFGPTNFRNEIIWHYNTGGKGKRTFLKKHDTILWYSKSEDYVFMRENIALPRAVGTAHLRQGVDEDGRAFYEDYSPRKSGKKYRWYLDEGLTPMDVWTDIQALNPVARERVGYPTQKPLALLERIIQAGSRPGDVVLDPFCGCGTAVDASERLGRRWIGIDITSLATGVIEDRLDRAFEAADFKVMGLPEKLDDAVDLAARDRFQFQWWAAGRIGAFPHDGRQKKGPDRGIDGIIPFRDDDSGRVKRCIVSVKSGQNIGPTDVRDLLGTVVANHAEAGVLITLTPPTPEMKRAASRAEVYQSPLGHSYPKVQILTVEDILRDRLPDLPAQESQKRRRQRIAAQRSEQQELPGWS